MKNFDKRNIFILSTIKLYQGNSAGSARMMNFAKALSIYNNVYLFSFTGDLNKTSKFKEVDVNIYINENKKSDAKFKRKLLYPYYLFMHVRACYLFAKNKIGRSIFYLYPSTKTLLDFIIVFYLVILKNQKVYCEINEVRRYSTIFLKSTNFFKNPVYYLRLKSKKLKYALSEKLSHFYKGLICISTNINKYYLKYNKNTIIVPILSDTTNILKRKITTYKKSDNFRICFSGMINIKKENLDLFFSALVIVKIKSPNFEFHMYGPVSNNELKKIQNILTRLNIADSVYYKGIVEQEELKKLHEQYHLLVIPRGNNRQNNFGFSTKLSEYLCSQVPTLITNVSDNGYYIKDGVNGFIVEPDNIQAMADKIVYIISNYNEITPSVCDNALQTAINKFDYKNYSEKINNFLC